MASPPDFPTVLARTSLWREAVSGRCREEVCATTAYGVAAVHAYFLSGVKSQPDMAAPSKVLCGTNILFTTVLPSIFK